jgi:hypothetical protein
MHTTCQDSPNVARQIDDQQHPEHFGHAHFVQASVNEQKSESRLSSVPTPQHIVAPVRCAPRLKHPFPEGLISNGLELLLVEIQAPTCLPLARWGQDRGHLDYAFQNINQTDNASVCYESLSAAL